MQRAVIRIGERMRDPRQVNVGPRGVDDDKIVVLLDRRDRIGELRGFDRLVVAPWRSRTAASPAIAMATIRAASFIERRESALIFTSNLCVRAGNLRDGFGRPRCQLTIFCHHQIRCLEEATMLHHRRQEYRKNLRRPMRRAAEVIFGTDESPVRCVIWDISDGGARLAVARPLSDLPPKFILVLFKEARVQRKCQVVWTDARFVGVKFL